MHKHFLLALIIGCLLSTPSLADPTVNFIGQFGNKAIMRIDGKQRTLNVGESSKEGIKLISVTKNNAVIQYQGQKQTLGFSSVGKSSYRKNRKTIVTLWADKRGHFETPGTINGQLVNFLIDTGATSVAMNEVIANKLGIDFRYSGNPIMVSTASGTVMAHRIKLNSVKVGEIELKNIEGTVLEGGYPTEVLLGMSFLSKVDIERKSNFIKLVKNR
jgi:aspartyl protease family protein